MESAVIDFASKTGKNFLNDAWPLFRLCSCSNLPAQITRQCALLKFTGYVLESEFLLMYAFPSDSKPVRRINALFF